MENKFDNSIVLFENEKYTEGSNQPKFKGNLIINGVKKDVAVWPKEKDGKVFFSGKISEPYVKQNPTPSNAPIDPLKRGQEISYPDAQENYSDLPF